MQRIRRDTLLGIVFFGTLAFLLWATVNLTDMSMAGVEPLEVWFEDGGGAPAGTNVLVLGKKVGKTGETEIDYTRPAFRVRMKLLLQEPIPLTDQYTIQIQDAGVLGGKQVYVDPGRGRPLPAGQELRGMAEPGAFERIGDIADGKGQLGQAMDSTLTAIRTFFENMNDEASTVGQLVRRRDLYDAVLLTVHNLNQVLTAVREGDGTIGRLVGDRELGSQFETMVYNLARASTALAGSDGTLGLLLNDAGAAQNVRATLADFATIVANARAGKGAIGRLLADPTTERDLVDALANLSAALRRVNDPDAGALGALFSDPETAKDVRTLLANIRHVTEQLTRSDSALGMLINDPQLGARLRRIFTQVSRALEDAREAAPIGNFVQVLLGAF